MHALRVRAIYCFIRFLVFHNNDCIVLCSTIAILMAAKGLYFALRELSSGFGFLQKPRSTCTSGNVCARVCAARGGGGGSQRGARAHAHTHALTRARAHTHTHTRSHAHTHTHTHTRTHVHTHTQIDR